MFPMHQISTMIKFTHVVGSLNWKNGRSVITVVWMSYSPTDNSYSSLRQLYVIFVTKIVCLQLILFYTKNVFIYVCLCLFVPFVISPILLIFVYGCTLLNLMEVGKQQFFKFRNCIVMLSCNLNNAIRFLYCHEFVIPANISSKCLIIVKGNN